MTTENKSTIEEAELGHRFDLTQLARCIAIYGAVAWPGENPGFAVVIGMIYSKMYLLAECECSTIPDLVNKCGIFNSDFRFNSAPRGRRWYGDYENPDAREYIQKMNQKNRDCPFHFYGSSDLNERDKPYAYLLPELKYYLDKGMLVLKDDSKVLEYMHVISDDPLEWTMKIGAYPAIEAVGIAAIKLQREFHRLDNYPANTPHKSAYRNNVLTRGLGNRRIM
ncbi:MAG: hypothetical protein ACYS4W_07355 [Planctomycetota bacterium]|jgi:hypothetical protein